MKQHLDKKQAQTLIDMGVDMSNTMLSIAVHNDTEWKETVLPNHLANKLLMLGATLYPTFTIGELIERLPEEVSGYDICIEKDIVTWREYDGNKEGLAFYNHTEIIDNLFDAYVQLIKDGVIN